MNNPVIDITRDRSFPSYFLIIAEMAEPLVNWKVPGTVETGHGGYWNL